MRDYEAHHEELAFLLGRWADEALSDDEASRLEEILTDSAQSRETYLEFIALHVHLEREHSLPAGDIAPYYALGAAQQNVPCRHELSSGEYPTTDRIDIHQRTARIFTQRLVLSFVVAAAVVSLLTVAMVFLSPPIHQRKTHTSLDIEASDPVVVAELTATHETVWSPTQVATHRGAYLVAGHRMDLREGMAEITYRNGAVVLLQAPAQFELLAKNAGRLRSGRLTAKLSEPADGFVVETSAATVTDLGTEFGVSVEGERVAIQVFVGSVEVDPKSKQNAGAKKRILLAGESLVCDPSGIVLASTTPLAETFRRTMPAPSPTVDITPKYVAGENFSRVLISGRGQATQNSNLQSFDAGEPVRLAQARNQYVWFDFSAALAEVPDDGVEKVFLEWTGTIRPATRNVPAVSAQLGVFPVPDDQRGIPTVFSRGDGQDHVRFYEAHVDELADAVTIPAVTENRRFRATWDITKLVLHWRSHPDDQQRGQLIIVNDQHPMWVSWTGIMPRLMLQLRKDTPAPPTN